MSEHKSLAAKLAEVMKEVERIPKRGYNDFHRYAYATEADIAEALRSELAKRNVVLIPAITGESRHPVGEKGSVLTVLEMEMEFLDGDTGQSIKKPWRGYGTDKEDKGGYKAMTGGEKYFLLKTFLMPTGDDPEATETPQQRPQARREPQRAPARPVPPAAMPPPAQGPSSGLTVKDTRVARTGEKNGKPWILYGVLLSDGRQAKTFSSSVYEAAQAAQRAGTTVEVDLDEKSTIVNFLPVRQTA